MARTARVVVPDYPHHVILRGNNRRRLFSYRSDFVKFLYLVGDALPRYSTQMHALAVMTNHVHMVLTARDAPAMASTVKAIAQRYAQYRNRRRDGSGKLYEERYRCFPVLSTEQLGVVTCYVDANPLRAGMVVDAFTYEWSTSALHAGTGRGEIPARLWTPSPWYEALAPDPERRAQRYVECMNDYTARGVRPDHVSMAEAAERLSATAYQRRLERPDGTRAQ